MEKAEDPIPTDEANPPSRGFSGIKLVRWTRDHKVIAVPLATMILLLPLLGLLALSKSHAEWTSPGVYPSRMRDELYMTCH